MVVESLPTCDRLARWPRTRASITAILGVATEAVEGTRVLPTVKLAVK